MRGATELLTKNGQLGNAPGVTTHTEEDTTIVRTSFCGEPEGYSLICSPSRNSTLTVHFVVDAKDSE